jgi:hypothetical protein
MTGSTPQIHHFAEPEPEPEPEPARPLIFWLKLLMVTGICFILLGHYLWAGLDLPATMGVPGIIIVAGCCAFGLILSLPTKIYLTLLLMERETVVPAGVQLVAVRCNKAGSSNNDAT